MNGRSTDGQQSTTNPALEHRLKVLIDRYEGIAATIPAAIPAELRRRYERYTDRAVRLLGKRKLARLHRPWAEQPQDGRVERGKVRQE